MNVWLEITWKKTKNTYVGKSTTFGLNPKHWDIKFLDEIPSWYALEELKNSSYVLNSPAHWRLKP